MKKKTLFRQRKKHVEGNALGFTAPTHIGPVQDNTWRITLNPAATTSLRRNRRLQGLCAAPRGIRHPLHVDPLLMGVVKGSRMGLYARLPPRSEDTVFFSELSETRKSRTVLHMLGSGLTAQ